MKTRRLDALPREEAVDSFAMDSQHAAHTHCIKTPVVNQPPHCLRMDAKLVRNLADAH